MDGEVNSNLGGYLLIWVLAVLFVVGIVKVRLDRKKGKERVKVLEAWAGREGLSFSPYREEMSSEHPYTCLTGGDDRYGFNVMKGNFCGFDSKLFDYYLAYQGKHPMRFVFSAILVGSPFPLLPIAIRPEDGFDKAAAEFGWEDINFESAEFSRRYHVKSPDKRWAYDVINSRTMERLLEVKGLLFEADESSMICYTKNRLFSTEEFAKLSELLASILNNIPEHARERAKLGYRK